MSVCVCVILRQRERGRERGLGVGCGDRGGERESACAHTRLGSGAYIRSVMRISVIHIFMKPHRAFDFIFWGEVVIVKQSS